jgi:hypothetical protein
MLKQFKSKRGKKANAMSASQMRTYKKPAKKEEESSDSDGHDDSSDSDYEELLISGLMPKKEEPASPVVQPVEKVEAEKDPPPLEIPPLERHETKPVNIPKTKPKSKKVIIKKYYNYKPKASRSVGEEKEEKAKTQAPAVAPVLTPVAVDYLGYAVSSNTPHTVSRNHMTNRIFNW